MPSRLCGQFMDHKSSELRSAADCCPDFGEDAYQLANGIKRFYLSLASTSPSGPQPGRSTLEPLYGLEPLLFHDEPANLWKLVRPSNYCAYAGGVGFPWISNNVFCSRGKSKCAFERHLCSLILRHQFYVKYLICRCSCSWSIYNFLKANWTCSATWNMQRHTSAIKVLKRFFTEKRGAPAYSRDHVLQMGGI